jgi:hypothetical protein
MNNLTSFFIFFSIIFLATLSNKSFADARKSNFRSKQKIFQRITLGGIYSSDYNSKQYKLSGAYKYSGSRFVNDLEFLHNTTYTSTAFHPLEKNKNLFDLELSSKILISNSSNYFNYYNRSKYDELSSYYYDLTNEIGWGRMFFDGIIEADINIGYNEIKNFESQIVINPNLKASFWLTDKIKMSTKAFIFKIKDSYSEELKSSISYQFNKSLSLQVYHKYEKKRFFDQKSKDSKTKNQVNRDLILRLRYSF